jgi:hypothetical protein
MYMMMPITAPSHVLDVRGHEKVPVCGQV